MKRREFVQGTTVLAAMAFLPETARSAAAVGAGRSFKLALTPGSIGVTVTSQRELNNLALRHGFEAVEPRPEELAAMSATQVSETLADLTAKKLT
jgi:hypothetical protein